MKRVTQRQVEVASLIYEGHVNLRDLSNAAGGIGVKAARGHVAALERKGIVAVKRTAQKHRPANSLTLTHYGLHLIGVPVCPRYYLKEGAERNGHSASYTS